MNPTESVGPVLDLRRGRVQRVIFFALGWVLLGLGLAGAAHPDMPTTGLVILAALAFGRSSVRFHVWLYYHPVFGPTLQRWRRYGVIPVPAKVLAMVVIGVGLGYLALSPGVSLWAAASVAPIMAAAAGYILTRPSRVSRRRALRLVVSS